MIVRSRHAVVGPFVGQEQPGIADLQRRMADLHPAVPGRHRRPADFLGAEGALVIGKSLLRPPGHQVRSDRVSPRRNRLNHDRLPFQSLPACPVHMNRRQAGSEIQTRDRPFVNVRTVIRTRWTDFQRRFMQSAGSRSEGNRSARTTVQAGPSAAMASPLSSRRPRVTALPPPRNSDARAIAGSATPYPIAYEPA